MKRKILAIMLMACLAFTACGSEKEAEESEVSIETENTEETGDEIPVVDKTVEKEGIDAFVTLGEYKGIELEKYIYTVEESDIDNQIQAELTTVPIQDTDPERTVEVGDVINLDYSGSIDGVVFDGGTAQGQTLEIGSGSFIDGFEDQLVGMHVGESGEIEVTFPEDYHSADLAGADAVFAVTINSIAEYLEEPTEEWLLANTNSTTLEEYREEVRAMLESNNVATAENGLYQSAWAALAASAEIIQYPQDMLDTCFEEQKLSYENYAMMYGMDFEAFLTEMGITEDDIYEEAKSNLQNVLIAEYVLEKEGIDQDNEDYKALESQILLSNGFNTREDALAAGVTEWNIDFVINYNFVLEFVVNNAVVTEVPAE